MKIPEDSNGVIDLLSRFVRNTETGKTGRIVKIQGDEYDVFVTVRYDGRTVIEGPWRLELLDEQFCCCGCGELVAREGDFYSDECREHPYQDAPADWFAESDAMLDRDVAWLYETRSWDS